MVTAVQIRNLPKQADVIVIDGDDDEEKQAAAAGSAIRPMKRFISLLDDSDDDNSFHRVSRSPRSDGDERKPSAKSSKRKADSMEKSDRKLAEFFQRQDEDDQRNEKADREMAKRLQQQEDLTSTKASARRERKNMEKSSYGRAVIAVQEIIALVVDAKKKYPILAQYNVDSVSQDDMVFLARQILDLQDEFKAKNLPSYIDIGYHYTNQNSMPHIRTNGLLTKADRESQKVTSMFHDGSVFGDGIYSSESSCILELWKCWPAYCKASGQSCSCGEKSLSWSIY